MLFKHALIVWSGCTIGFAASTSLLQTILASLITAVSLFAWQVHESF